MNQKVLDTIREQMQIQGYSQPKLAELAGISFLTLNNNLLGKTRMTDKTAEKVLSVFGLTLEDVLTGGDASLNTSVRGYLEYNGEIKRINSFKDVENFVRKYEEEVKELPRRVREDKKDDEKNKKVAKKHKAAQRKKQWPIDCENAYKLGEGLARKARTREMFE